MSIVKINAITVPADSGDELARRFAARAGAVDGQAGFEGFELLRPTDGRTTWLVVTRWADEESFQAWASGQDFRRAHAGTSGAGEPAGPGGGEDRGGHGEQGGHGGQRPVGMSAELWSFDIATGSEGSNGSAG